MTIFKKSMITLGAAVIVFTTIFIISVMLFMDSLYYEINKKSLENTAKILMSTIGNDRLTEIFTENTKTSEGNSAEENYFSLPVNAGEEYRLTLIDINGYVLWDSHVTERLVNHIDREEVIAALEGKESSSKRESISTSIKRFYYAMPVFDNEKVIGVFRLSISIPGFGSRVSPVAVPFFIFIYIFIFAAFSAILMFSRSLSASLERLVNIAQTSTQMISGDETASSVTPEFISLEKALRIMAEEIRERFEQAKTEGCRLEAILNGMSEAVFAMDSGLKLHLINPKAKELFNLGDRDIKTMTLLEATFSAELAAIAKKAIGTGSTVETELTFHCGVLRHFHVFASPLKDAKIGVVLVLQEITQLLKLERIRKDFVANVSHELRTPIHLIKGFSETLMDSVTDKKNAHFIEIINKNAQTMENITNDLLMLAGLENTQAARKAEECIVSDLINEAVLSVEPQAKEKQIEIIVNCEKDLTVLLYGSLITQALINLLDNGIKYSHKKSKLWISACFSAGEANSQELLLEVRDSGIGIPSEHLERIFERFYRVDRARSRDAGGTGLGLSIVRHIALLHNGVAEAESRVEEGSVFRIRIPVQPRVL